MSTQARIPFGPVSGAAAGVTGDFTIDAGGPPPEGAVS